MYKNIGKSIPRIDGYGHVTGKTLYPSDIKIPGMLVCKVLRNPYHKAKIVSLDVSQAQKMPGVYGVITSKDVPNNVFGLFPDQHVLAEEISRFRGQSIAAVAAVDQATALEALSKIKLELEELPAVTNPLEAMKEDAPKVRPEGNIFLFEEGVPYRRIRRGNVEEGFAQADFIIEGTYDTPSQEHAPLESACSIAYLDKSGKLIIHSKSQGMYFALGDLCNILKLPMNKVQLVGGTIGGGFGGMNSIITDHIAALLALKSGKPVRFEFTREEEMMASTIRSPWIFKFKDGIRKDGLITARSIEIIHDNGAYTELGLYALEKNANFVAGANMIRNLSINSYLVYTNRVPGSSMRGFGVNPGQYAEQVQLNKLAEAIGMDPFEIRFINAFKEGDISHAGNPLVAVSGIETLQGVARMAGISLPEKYVSMSSKGGEMYD